MRKYKIMSFITFLLVVMLLSGLAAFADVPQWEVSPDFQQNSMHFAVQVAYPDDTLVDEDGSLLATFDSEGAVRGESEIEEGDLFILQAWSDEEYDPDGLELSFKVYDAASGDVLSLSETVVFVADEDYGSPGDPKILTIISDYWTLSLLAPEGDGTTDPQTGDHDYPVGQPGEVSAVPDAGWELDRWRLGGEDAGVDETITVDPGTTGEVKELQAVFRKITYTLTYTAGAGGTVNGEEQVAQMVAHGADAQPVIAEPDDGFVFIGWSDGKTDAERTDTNVSADISLTAQFSETGMWTLSILAPDGQGTTEPAPGKYTDIEVGVSLTVTALPKTGWMISHWLLDGVVTGMGQAALEVPSAEKDESHTLKGVFITEIQYEIDRAVEAGDDVVEIESGVYTAAEPIIVHSDGLTLRAAESRTVMIMAEGGDTAIAVRADDVTVEGFVIEDFTKSGIEVRGSNAYVFDNEIEGNGVESSGIVIDGSQEPEGVQDAVISSNDIEKAKTGIMVRGNVVDAFILNNKITGNEVGIAGEEKEGHWPTNTRAVNNNIYGNMLDNADLGGTGVEWAENVDAPKRLRATLNWWGDDSGPYNETENDTGLGDAVSGDVDFRPWLKSETRGVGRGVFAVGDVPVRDIPGGIGVATGAGDAGEVFAAAVDTLPAGVPARPGAVSYANILVNSIDRDDGLITGLTVELGYKEPIHKVVYWFDGQEWRECSEGIVEWDPPGEQNPFETGGYDGFVRIVIDSEENTRPWLGDFSGRILALDSDEPEEVEERKKRSSSRSWYECFIATAAYGTPQAPELDSLRALRDQVLLTASAGRSAADAYYKFSPPVAQLIGRSDTACAVVRQILRPVVHFSRNVNQKIQ